MKIHISTSSTPRQVITGIYATVEALQDGDRKPGSLVYTNASCWGAIAHYLASNWSAEFDILLFGSQHGAAHGVLFNRRSGKIVVDTFKKLGGTLVQDGKKITGYKSPSGAVYALMSVTKLTANTESE